MSYDLYLYRVPPGRDPEEVFDEEMELEESGDDASTDDPELERYASEIEQVLGDDATCYRSARHLAINIPYHFEGAEAQRLYSRVAECLHRACAEGGLTVYDPQEGRVIDPRRDLQSMLHSNERGRAMMREIEAPSRSAPTSRAGPNPPGKPWWRFW